MKPFIFVILAVIIAVDPATVKKINATKEAAEEAFKSGHYAEAIRHYKTLTDSLGVDDDAVILNLANAYYLAKDTANAFSRYQAVVESAQSEISSKAHQQLGVMLNKRGKPEEALQQFKAAIKAEPANDAARYNYEMLKKKLEEEKKKQEQQQQNKDQKNDKQNEDQQKKDQQNKDQQQKDQENKDEQNKDQQQKEQEQKEKEQKEEQQKQQQEKEQQEQQQKDAKKEEMPNLDRQKLEQMKISEEKARMILEAMKNQERQYLQQQRRKATQPKDPNKPDW